MKMVLLAAGHGRRFGGLKQLAPVGPEGEALIDYTVRDAEAAGFDGIVLVVREEIRRQLLAHAAEYWPTSLSVRAVVQGAVPGTVPAVLAAAAVIDGPFAVANADDLYGAAAIAQIAGHLAAGAGHAAGGGDAHVLVGYRLRDTVLGARPVKRGLCVLDEGRRLADLVEHHVSARPDGSFAAMPLVGAAGERILSGDEPVSMNLWGFYPRIFDALADAAARQAPGPGGELLLPDVLGALVRGGGERVQVVPTRSACVGITHRDDLALVRASVAEQERRAAQRAHGAAAGATADGDLTTL